MTEENSSRIPIENGPEFCPSKEAKSPITSLKVSKFQKQIFLCSFEPKTEQNYFLNSALASKMSQIKKMKALYYIN